MQLSRVSRSGSVSGKIRQIISVQSSPTFSQTLAVRGTCDTKGESPTNKLRGNTIRLCVLETIWSALESLSKAQSTRIFLQTYSVFVCMVQ